MGFGKPSSYHKAIDIYQRVFLGVNHCLNSLVMNWIKELIKVSQCINDSIEGDVVSRHPFSEQWIYVG